MLSMKSIRESRSFDIAKLWVSRTAFYVLFLFLSFGLSHYIVLNYGPSTYNMASARYLISAIIQSEAAIMAIIVTLSLVAVELASSSYSVRMIDLLKLYNPDFWILMVVYIISMVFSMFVLKSIPDESTANMELMVSFAYHTGVYSFLILFPYLFRTLKMLKPSTLLNMQAMKLTAHNITKAISSDAGIVQKKDPIQPIIDIVSGSLLNHDFETTRNGINIIGIRAREIFIHNDLEETERKMVANYIFSRLARYGKFTLTNNDEDATFIVLKNLEMLWDELKKKDPSESVLQASSSLEQIGTVSADLYHKNVLSTVTNQLYDIGQKALDKNYDGEVSRIIDSLASVCISCIEKRTDPRLVDNIIHSISILGMKASETEQESSVSQSIESLDALKLSLELVDVPEYQRLYEKADKIAGSIRQN